MPRDQKTYAPFFLSKRFAPLVAIPLVVAGTTVMASCSHDWNSYDPRIDEGSSSSSGMGGAVSSSSSGTAGAGGMAGNGGSGGSGGSGGMSMGGMGGAGGGITCVPDSGKACYSGPNGTENVGVCKGGATLCLSDGMSYGPCLGEVTPIVEECGTAAVDDDCNGAVNDHCGLWAVRAGNALEQRAQAVAVDSAGNSIMTGRMFGTADFGGGVLTSAGGYDIFVAKYDKTGKHVWSKLFGGAMDDQGLGIAVDAAGNCFVSGFFIGAMSIGADIVTAVEGQDAFIIKLDPMGQVLGNTILGGLTDQSAAAVTVDAANNVYVTGTFATDINTSLGKLVAVNLSDGFIMKFDNGLIPSWQKAFGGTGNDEGSAITTDSAGNVILTGYFDTAIDFGGGVVNGGSGLDVFLAKLTSTGSHLLSKGFPVSGNQYGDAVAVDSMGNMYVHGDFDTAINLGGGQVATAGLHDVYLTKFDAAGTHVFTKVYGDPEDQLANAMTVDKNDDIVFIVNHEGTVDYGGGPITYALNVGSSDVVVVKLKGATGAYVWSRRFGNVSDQDARAIATDATNNIFVAGEFGGTMNFGPVSITSSSSDDAYLVKFGP